MKPPVIIPLLLSLALFTSCETSEKRKPTEAERLGIVNVLAGEWVMPSNQQEYLLFKPDGGTEKTGRFGGLGDYDRYEIKSGLFMGRSFDVELISAMADTDMPTVKVNVSLAPDGRSLNLVVPGKSPTRRTYRKMEL